jgi:hypothetical protein
MSRQADKSMERWIDRGTDRQIDAQKDIMTDRQTGNLVFDPTTYFNHSPLSRKFPVLEKCVR